MNLRSKVTLNEIADWFKNDEVFFLIGAGFSASSTRNSVGTGKQLAQYLTNIIDDDLKNYDKNNIKTLLDEFLVSDNKINKENEIISYINKVILKENVNLKEVCDRIITGKSEKEYKKLVEEYFNQRDNLVLETHENIVPIIVKKEKEKKSPLIVSLNIDELIENAYSIYYQGKKRIAKYIGGLSKDDFSRLDQSLIWKFHGCVSDMNTVVFSTFSYYRFKRDHKESIDNLKRLFRNKHCILLGLSLQDDHIRDLIFELYENNDMPQAVIVTPEKYLNEQFLDYMNEYISMAYYKDEISSFLKELDKLI